MDILFRGYQAFRPLTAGDGHQWKMILTKKWTKRNLMLLSDIFYRCHKIDYFNTHAGSVSRSNWPWVLATVFLDGCRWNGVFHLRTGRCCGGSVQDLQAGPLQRPLRSRSENGGFHLLRGRGHQPAGQGTSVSNTHSFLYPLVRNIFSHLFYGVFKRMKCEIKHPSTLRYATSFPLIQDGAMGVTFLSSLFSLLRISW